MEHYNEQATVEIAVSTSSGWKPDEFKKITLRATGFYVQRIGSSETFLITNWHVVTGRDPQSRDFIKPERLRPVELLVREWSTDKILSIPLYDDEDKPRWREIDDEVPFEVKTSVIDVVAIPVPTSVNPIFFGGLTSALYQHPQPNDEVVVMGYPYHRFKCIWKTCHIAESIADHRTYFLINGRTKEGMSGSGVFTTAERSQHGHVLIGIYSGRISEVGVNRTLNDLDLGIVWKLHALNRLIPN